jgi:hypothetical protein
MKQLNWWRGLWRVWVIGTVAWAAWSFWESKPPCLSIGDDHLCHDRPGFEDYAGLLVQMFGWPVLIAILMLASRWAIAGFSEPNKPSK